MSDLIERLNELCERHKGVTPGEWVAIPQNDGSAMIAREYETGNQMRPKGLRLICHVLARRDSLPMDEANAAALADLPTMLAALRESAAEVERLKDEAKTVDGLFALSQEHGKRLTAAFSAQQQRNAELTDEVERLRAELRECNCPRPINTATDESTAWCVDNGHCGCGRNVLLGVEKGHGYAAIREAGNG